MACCAPVGIQGGIHQAQLIETQSLWPEKRTRAASSAVGDRSDDGAVRAVDDDFDVFGFVRPVDCILMYAPGTKRKHDQTANHRDLGFHDSHAIGLRASVEPSGEQ